MKMDMKTPGCGTLPIQAADATICSNDSAYALGNNVIKPITKPGGKIKAYVDFSDFNKNYEEYLNKTGRRESIEELAPSDTDESPNLDTKTILERQSSTSSNQSEGWEVLSFGSTDRPMNVE